jgi:hypothetical protein
MERRNTPDRFFENIILTVIVWVGIWGIITLVIDHYLHSFWARLATYIAMTSTAFMLLCLRDHIV